MRQSKLLDVLRRLSGVQLNRFKAFLASPYFNKNTDNSLFFQYLLPHAPAFESPQLDRERVLKKLKLSKTLNEKTLAYQMSELLRLLELFLQIDQFLAHPVQPALALVEVYGNLDLSKHYSASLRKTRKAISGEPYRDIDHLRHLHQLARLEDRHAQQHRRTYRPELQAAADALDRTYITEKLRYCLEMTNSAQVLDIHYDLHLGEAMIRWARERNFDDTPIIQLYLQALMMMQSPEELDHFENFKTTLAAQEALLPPAELKNLYTYLLNYCTRRINYQGDKSFYYQLLDINRSLLEKGLLLENGELAPWRYSNIATSGLRTGQLDWTLQFLKDNKHLLPEAFRENIYHYNLGNYLYHKKDYDQAQRTLQQVELKDLLLAIGTKNLLVKIYYETEQTELLLYFLEAYRIYIYRQSKAKAHLKKQVGNFIDLTRKLAKLENFEKENLRTLKEELPAPGEVHEREWLVMKMEEKMI